MLRVLTLTAVVLLLCTAGAAVWRSTAASGTPDAREIAAGLRCLACEGETVADSASPVAAGMREVIDDQLAAGRTEEQVRAWFADRYGPDVLADPSRQGIGALLWALPCAALLTGLGVATRALRRPRAPADEKPRHAGAPGPRDLVWYAIALTVVGVVAGVALSAQQSTPARTAAPAAESPDDPLAEQLALARQRERQQDYAGAADSYRTAAEMRPDPGIRLRLAFALLRSNQPAEAASVARQVLQDRQDDPDALLLLGLALRAENSPEAEPTLRRFLELAPQHPAVAEVHDLLGLP